jgi:hypothetical protein
MVEQLMEEDRCTGDSEVEAAAPDWRAALKAELDRSIVHGGRRWSRALMAVAWIHLLAFAVCHLLHSPRIDSDPRHILVWFIELVTIFVVMRAIAGRGWFWSPPAVHLIGRMWLTLLILSFSLSTLNATIGWETLWFKAAWGTLSSFFFAVLAWLFTPRFLILAVQMYFTALLMARFMDWNNLIYGVSWWLALMGIAWTIRRREHGATEQAVADLDSVVSSGDRSAVSQPVRQGGHRAGAGAGCDA